jgi:hypothetical protein
LQLGEGVYKACADAVATPLRGNPEILDVGTEVFKETDDLSVIFSNDGQPT